MEGHPGVETVYIERSAYHCPRCRADRPGWVWFGITKAVPLADGRTLVCWRCATPEERRNRWCGRCRQVLDQDCFDRFERRPGERGWREACRSCRAAEPPAERACEHCREPFTPARKDARFCSARCRVAAHRAKR